MKLTTLGRNADIKPAVRAELRRTPPRDTPRKARRANGPTVAIILAGALRPSPLRQALDIPVLLLPMAPDRTLLDVWLETIRAESVDSSRKLVDSVTIVVSSRDDADALRQSLRDESSLAVDVMVDPNRWRGPGGLVRDIARSCGVLSPLDTGSGNGHVSKNGRATARGRVLVVEAACLPPPAGGLAAMLEHPAARDSGIIGSASDGTPAGLYLFTSEALSIIPAVGYFDLKEQLLPALYTRGRPAAVTHVANAAIRVRDSETYLRAASTVATRNDSRLPMISPAARIDAAAHVLGSALVEEGAVISDGAIVHESIVLAGARLGSGAVVSRSIVGPGVNIPPDCMVRGQILSSTSRASTSAFRKYERSR